MDRFGRHGQAPTTRTPTIQATQQTQQAVQCRAATILVPGRARTASAAAGQLWTTAAASADPAATATGAFGAATAGGAQGDCLRLGTASASAAVAGASVDDEPATAGAATPLA